LNDDAIEQFSKALLLDPGNDYARNNLGLSQVRKGMLEEGIREMEKIKVDKGRSPSMCSDLAYVYAKAGRVDDVRKLLSEWLNEVETNHELAVAIASAYTSLGDRDKAIEWLERAYSEHVTVLISANADFVFDSIRTDPRFQSLMRKLGFTILS
jgi:Flp pilus assembly protein TadD